MSTSGAAPAPILTEAELKLLQALVYQECGMHFDERRTHFLQDRLLRRLKECRARLLLRLLPAAHQPARQGRTGQAAGEPDGQRDQLLPPQGATGSVSERRARRIVQAEKFAARVFDPHLERGLLHRAGSLHAGHAGHRRAGLLLPAQSPAHGLAVAEAAGAAAVAGGDSGQRHQLLRAARRAGRRLQREPDVDGRLRLPPALLRQSGASATPSRSR